MADPPPDAHHPEMADELVTSTAQITVLVRRSDLPAFKLGGWPPTLRRGWLTLQPIAREGL